MSANIDWKAAFMAAARWLYEPTAEDVRRGFIEGIETADERYVADFNVILEAYNASAMRPTNPFKVGDPVTFAHQWPFGNGEVVIVEGDVVRVFFPEYRYPWPGDSHSGHFSKFVAVARTEVSS